MYETEMQDVGHISVSH